MTEAAEHDASTNATSEGESPRESAPTLEAFWRPGCPYCMRLKAGLAREGIEAQWRNIWQDDEAAAIVRLANNGNETVPTVRFGNTTLTNPSAGQVRALIEG